MRPSDRVSNWEGSKMSDMESQILGAGLPRTGRMIDVGKQEPIEGALPEASYVSLQPFLIFLWTSEQNFSSNTAKGPL